MQTESITEDDIDEKNVCELDKSWFCYQNSVFTWCILANYVVQLIVDDKIFKCYHRLHFEFELKLNTPMTKGWPVMIQIAGISSTFCSAVFDSSNSAVISFMKNPSKACINDNKQSSQLGCLKLSNFDCNRPERGLSHRRAIQQAIIDS